MSAFSASDFEVKEWINNAFRTAEAKENTDVSFNSQSQIMVIPVVFDIQGIVINVFLMTCSCKCVQRAPESQCLHYSFLGSLYYFHVRRTNGSIGIPSKIRS